MLMFLHVDVISCVLLTRAQPKHIFNNFINYKTKVAVSFTDLDGDFVRVSVNFWLVWFQFIEHTCTSQGAAFMTALFASIHWWPS